jgi:hypothetical protein
MRLFSVMIFFLCLNSLLVHADMSCEEWFRISLLRASGAIYLMNIREYRVGNLPVMPDIGLGLL